MNPGSLRRAADLAGILCVLPAVLLFAAAPAEAQWFLPWFKKKQPPPQQTRPVPKRTAPVPKPRKPAPPPRVRTYRTLCVRVCDGFYFPISFRVPRSRFADDASSCEQRCSGNARLFVYRNPGQRVSSAVDLKGNRYRDLKNAFRYRKELVKGCSCDEADLPETEQGGQ